MSKDQLCSIRNQQRLTTSPSELSSSLSFQTEVLQSVLKGRGFKMFGIVRQPIVSLRSILSLQSSTVSTAIRNTTRCNTHPHSIVSKWSSSQVVQRQSSRTIVQQHGPISRAIYLKRCSRPLFNQSKPFFSNSAATKSPDVKINNSRSYNSQSRQYEPQEPSTVQYSPNLFVISSLFKDATILSRQQS